MSSRSVLKRSVIVVIGALFTIWCFKSISKKKIKKELEQRGKRKVKELNDKNNYKVLLQIKDSVNDDTQKQV